MSPGIDKKLRRLKYILLFIILSTCFILGHTAPAPLETYITLFTGHGTLLARIILGLVLIATLFPFDSGAAPSVRQGLFWVPAPRWLPSKSPPMDPVAVVTLVSKRVLCSLLIKNLD